MSAGVVWIIFLTAVLVIGAVVMGILTHTITSRERKKLSAVLSASEDFVIIWKNDGETYEINEALKKKLAEIGIPMSYSLIYDIFCKNSDSSSCSPIDLTVRALGTEPVESTFTSPNAEMHYIVWRSSVIASDRKHSRIASVGMDITEKVQMKNALETSKLEREISKESFNIATESAEIGIVTITVESFDFRLHLSDSGRKILRCGENETVTLDDINRRVSGVDYNDYMFQLNQLLSGASDSMNMEIKLSLDDGVYHNFMLKFRNIKDEYGSILRIVGAFIDLTAQRENFKLYDRSANEDQLTALPNRRGFMAQGVDFLQRCKQKQTKAAVIAVKILKLTKINTLFGIETGDKLVQLYAEGLARYTGGKALLGHIGSDDFAVLLEYIEASEIERLIKSLQIYIENACDNVRLPSTLKEQARFIAGICYYDTYDDIMTLYNKANITLYTGTNINATVCHYFDETIEQKVCERELIEQEITEALKNNEFELFYQPKISFKNGTMLGAEALIRWHHPKKGLIMPADFIPIAEESGFITKIDEWGMHEACRQNKVWQNQGFSPVRVSVNVSQAQLFQTDLVACVKDSLDESALEPQYLEVELTETMAMQDIDYTIEIFNRIRELGVFVSMDDFGTGYSSLSSLKVLPIDILKIDKELIYDIEENDTARHITKAIVELGKAMNLQVLAEGVETEQQCRLLESIGCDVAQGFYYGRPVSAAELERVFFMPERARRQTEAENARVN